MKLINQTSSTITTNTFEIDVNGKKIVYIEYLNEKGKVTDFNLRDDAGNEINEWYNPTDSSPAKLLEEIQEFVDSLESK